jgi:hypothetical protein
LRPAQFENEQSGCPTKPSGVLASGGQLLKSRANRMGGDEQRRSSSKGQYYIIPRGTQHCPWAENECHVMLFEPKTVVNTGDVVNERTIDHLEKIERSYAGRPFERDLATTGQASLISILQCQGEA